MEIPSLIEVELEHSLWPRAVSFKKQSVSFITQSALYRAETLAVATIVQSFYSQQKKPFTCEAVLWFSLKGANFPEELGVLWGIVVDPGKWLGQERGLPIAIKA